QCEEQEPTSPFTFCCSICLDLLKDPVTIPCGHSYCMSCIKECWDGEEHKEIYSCPQCRQTFTPRPVLVKNTMLAELLEEMKKTGLQAAPPDLCYAGPGDVACDFCSGRKLKALKSCLACLASYCEHHLQPHYDIAPLKKHKLVEATVKLQENICSNHDEVMKIFCRTDQQCICSLCSMDEHKGHDTVSAAAERKERQKELGVSRQKIQQRIQDTEKDVKVLQQEVEEINRSADKAVEDSEEIFTELISLMEKRRSDVKQQIRSQQKEEVSRAEEVQEKLKQEIAELRRKDAELEQLSHTPDHTHFLLNYPSLSCLSESTDSPSNNIRPLSYFEDVTAAVSELREKLQQWSPTFSTPQTGLSHAIFSQPRGDAGLSAIIARAIRARPGGGEVLTEDIQRPFRAQPGGREVMTKYIPPPFRARPGGGEVLTKDIPPPLRARLGGRQVLTEDIPPPLRARLGGRQVLTEDIPPPLRARPGGREVMTEDIPPPLRARPGQGRVLYEDIVRPFNARSRKAERLSAIIRGRLGEGRGADST
uniref:RING-type domain-containing protein n=1 Tax=Myripristis murdjan TaxID=586833 RepID=A0A667ZL46_9TELE